MPEQLSPKPLVVVTGCSGLIGSRLMQALREQFRVVGMDVKPLQESVESVDWIKCDLTEQDSVQQALHELRSTHGDQIASVVHLAAYYDFSGEPSPLYQELTVEGTRRLLQALQQFRVEQFVFSSTLLMMRPADEGERLSEASPTEAEWEYPKSKLETERLIQAERQNIPAVILRIAGVYDRHCRSLPIAQQISRIYEKQMESYFFPGRKNHGQSFIHLDDLVNFLLRTVEMRNQLDQLEVFLVGEEDVMSYDELQDELGKLIHGKEWPTIRIPKLAAKAGAWVKNQMAGDDEDAPFIKPWMVDLADQNYPVSVRRAREKLGWSPKNRLRDTLPAMIAELHADPQKWYEMNKLPVPDDIAHGSKGTGAGR